MTIQDLKYITPLDIEAAHLNVTSAEMYDEAKKFNQHMYDMQRRRHRFLRDMWSLILLNIFMFAVAMPTAMSSYTSLAFRLSGGSGLVMMAKGGNLFLTYLPAVIYAAAFVYFIVIKKFYSSSLIFILTLIAVPTNYAFLLMAIFNAILVKKMNDVDNEIKEEPGYPGFAELHLSFIRDEESLEEGGMENYSDDEKSDDLESERKENPFDKYRTRWGSGEGAMLADNDISNINNN